MKQALRLTLLLTLASQTLSAQTTYQKTYGTIGNEMASSVQQTSDQGYILSGIYFDQSLYALRIDANGDTLWTKKMFGGLDAASIQTNDGGFMLAGYMSDQVLGCNDFKLVKTDANGTTLWSHLYLATMDAMNISIIQTSDNGYLVAGTTDSTDTSPSQNYDFKIVKVDANGTYQWSKTYGGTGMNDDEKINAIYQCSDLGYVLLGEKNNDIYLIKTDELGNTIWSKTFGGTGSDTGNSIKQAADGSYLVAGGTMSSGQGLNDVYLLKIDGSGNEIWSKTYGTAASELAFSLQITSTDEYLLSGPIAGSSNSEDILLLKTATDGTLIWANTFGGSGQDRGLSMDLTQENGAIIAGYSSSFGIGGMDIYLIKTDANGMSHCNESSINLVSGSFSSSGTPVLTPERNWGGPGNEPGFDFPAGNSGVQPTISCESAALTELATTEKQWTIFPNPVTGSAVLSSTNPAAEAVLITDLLGKSLMTCRLDSELIQLNSGTYIVKVINEHGQVLSIEKLTVE